MTKVATICMAIVAILYSRASAAPVPTESIFSRDIENARRFLSDYNKNATSISRRNSEANWAYETDLSDTNLENVVRLSLEESQFNLQASQRAGEIKTLDLPADLLRQVTIIRRTADPTSTAMRKEVRETIGKMEGIFSKGAIVKTMSDGKNKSYPLHPDLIDIMKASRNPRKLRWAWRGWRDAVGPLTRPLFEKMVDLLNVGARERGWIDYGDYLRSDYEMGDDFQLLLRKVWSEMEPLYKELHAYVRHKLILKYGSHIMNKDGCIPAHLLGDMYAQNWENIFDIVKPKQDSKAFDITDRLRELNYTIEKIVSEAEKFFTSITLDPMPASFWNRSVFRKIPGKEMVCHASAWDFSTDSDVRIKMCMELSQEHYTTIHHEMGHLEYFLAYKDQPYAFRNGANPGFHEAIGDTVSLSVETPTYLHEKKLIKSEELNQDDRISFLLNQALRRLAPIPYNLLVDEWRWRVFEGNITESTYNQEWWKLRVNYQGVEPPIKRPGNAFDPASKYHIGANVPYIAYFVSYVLQFQLHKAFCKEAGFQGPLYLCSIYGSKEAGRKFKAMLRAGRSKPWQKTLKAATGNRELSANAILEYFQPLREWLEKEREEEKYPIGWENRMTKPVLRKTSERFQLGQERSGILKTSSGDLSLSINIPAITFGSIGLEAPRKNRSEYSEASNKTKSSSASSAADSSPSGVIDLAKLLSQGSTLSIKSSEMSAVSKGGSTQYDNKQVNIETERASPSSNESSESMANETAKEGEYTKGNKSQSSLPLGDTSRQHRVGYKANSTRLQPTPALPMLKASQDLEDEPQSALIEKAHGEVDAEQQTQGQETSNESKKVPLPESTEENFKPKLKESSKASKNKSASVESIALPIGTPGEPMRLIPISIPESLLNAIAVQAVQLAANKSLKLEKESNPYSSKSRANRTKSHTASNALEIVNATDGAETAKDVTSSLKTGEGDTTTTTSVLPCKRNPDGVCFVGKVAREGLGGSKPEGESEDHSNKKTVSVSPSLLVQKLLEPQSVTSSAPEPVANEVKVAVNKTGVEAADDTTLQANKKSSKESDSESKSMSISDNDIGNIIKALTTSKDTPKSALEETPRRCKRGVSLSIGCDDVSTLEHRGGLLSMGPAEIIQRLMNSRQQAMNRDNLSQAKVVKTPNGFQLNFDLNAKDKVSAELTGSLEDHGGRQQHVDVRISPKGIVVKPKSSVQLMKPSFVPVQNAENLELNGKDNFS